MTGYAYEHMSDDTLLDYHNTKLTPGEVAAVKAHLAECEQCATRAADIQYWGGFMREHMEEQGEDIGAQ
jgi:anti-sigma factor RsiW